MGYWPILGSRMASLSLENKTGKDIWDQDNTGFGTQLSWDVTDTINAWFSYQQDETDAYTNGLIAQGVLITPYITNQVTQDDFFYSEQYQWDRENSGQFQETWSHELQVLFGCDQGR